MRTSPGFESSTIQGNYFKKQDVLYFPNLDREKVLCVEITRQSSDKNMTHFFVQSALLYTTDTQELRIRVHNVCYPLTNIKQLCYEYMDCVAIALYYTRVSQHRLQQNNFNFNAVMSTLELTH